jgi:hypothetical protein
MLIALFLFNWAGEGNVCTGGWPVKRREFSWKKKCTCTNNPWLLYLYMRQYGISLNKSVFHKKIFLHSHENLSIVSFTMLEGFVPNIVSKRKYLAKICLRAWKEERSYAQLSIKPHSQSINILFSLKKGLHISTLIPLSSDKYLWNRIDLKGFWRRCTLYRIHIIFLDFFYRPVFQKTRRFGNWSCFCPQVKVRRRHLLSWAP